MKLRAELQPALLELATLERALSVNVKPQLSKEALAVEQLEVEVESIESAYHGAQLAVDDMELEILRIQEDERKLIRRKEDNLKQLGADTDPERRKDIRHDLHSAKVRISDIVGELQEAHNQIYALRTNRDKYKTQLAQLREQLHEARNAYENRAVEDTAVKRTQRIDDLRLELPSEVVREYEEQRKENEVGVASFNGRSCGGCFIVLPPADVMAINKTAKDILPQCPDCGSYLVRTNA
ncbi:Zn-ribbon protein [Corynebacterium kutscheri]|uniref:Zn-ribbon protein n=1 Tax=Corynebacterium kutscheri TaxID=35755 RepID=A0AB38VXA5_9CORY|nr:C4-type zinc ribbon domain-containing protein [Corynebacterium kutscheri]VEH06833.1 Zn-ribbon protein [Corynebacterium kutscheri]VEH79360.1 Zn-ribbon protein [Corynebacterium kutscheri]